MAEIWGAVALGVGALGAGYIAAQGAKAGAQTQAQAQENAAQINLQEFNTITKQEQPYMQAGSGSLESLLYGLGIGPNTGGGVPGMQYGSLTAPFTTKNWQELSPAYNFTKQQGIQGVLNTASPNQGSMSGPALKDLIDYNQNAALGSFGNAFNMYQTQQGNIFNRLTDIATLGQTAAANTGQTGASITGNIGQAVGNVGSALGAGQVGAANAYSGAVSSLPWLYAGNQGQGWSPNYYPPGSVSEQGTYSDRKMKKDIQRIGTLESGLPIYRFRYRYLDEVYHLGVMADEAQKIFPDAVKESDNGFLLVDYGKIR